MSTGPGRGLDYSQKIRVSRFTATSNASTTTPSVLPDMHTWTEQQVEKDKEQVQSAQDSQFHHQIQTGLVVIQLHQLHNVGMACPTEEERKQETEFIQDGNPVIFPGKLLHNHLAVVVWIRG